MKVKIERYGHVSGDTYFVNIVIGDVPSSMRPTLGEQVDCRLEFFVNPEEVCASRVVELADLRVKNHCRKLMAVAKANQERQEDLRIRGECGDDGFVTLFDLDD
jgi:hypothetical protein